MTLRSTTGHADLDQRINELVDAALSVAGTDRNRDQIREMVTNSVRYALDRPERLDLKIASTALAEMREATQLFAPYRGRRKVTIFGSARTTPDDPLYQQTREVAAKLAAADWMVITGAGPGIMAAGSEGAGRDHALGVTIQLPFESGANEFLDEDNVIEMKYFFTRKLALIRESDGFIVMPGGFGTLDEGFELLTLLQTGKATPVPVVMLGLGRGFWRAFEEFVDVVIEQGYAGASDRALYTVTNDANEAAAKIIGFYANFRSLRWVRDQLVLRLNTPLTDARLADINTEFATWLGPDGLRVTSALAAEVSDSDDVDAARLVTQISRRQPGRLRQLIDAVNQPV
jgi:uncharacterized protein (TIGR00730 family)